MGGRIDRFVDEFGPAQRTFDHRGTRFITLDTSSLTIRGGGYAQEQGVAAAVGRGGQGPVRPLGDGRRSTYRPATRRGQQAQPADGPEGGRSAGGMAGRLPRTTGKGAAFIGSARRRLRRLARGRRAVSGQRQLGQGTRRARPAEGGFTGWSMVGVDQGAPRHGNDWIAAQTRAHVDGLSPGRPDAICMWASRRHAAATVVQGEGETARKVPVGWPVSADWSGSGGLCVKFGAKYGPQSRAVRTRTRVTAPLRTIRGRALSPLCGPAPSRSPWTSTASRRRGR